MTGPTLDIALANQTGSSTVYCYIQGLAINNNNTVFLLQADGRTYYYPSSPSSTGAPLAVDCAIPLGAPGSSRTVTIPQIAGGRIWFSVDGKLTFLLNPGPALVEPSVTNTSDPNYAVNFDFAEFTFNSSQIFANISYVDFVALPVALTLTNTAGQTSHVSGMASNGLETVASGLRAQGGDWGNLIVNQNGRDLRALSPNSGIALNNSLFSGYYQGYVDAVWNKYSSSPLRIDTQAQWGNVSGQVSNNMLTFNGVGSFAQPSARDIFSCSTGPFSNSSIEMGALTARLSAAFNRSTLLTDTLQPDIGQGPANFYQDPTTNHYSRIVHAANLDHRGYAFPYDDVSASGAVDQSGEVNDGAPVLLTVTVGGGNAFAA